MSKARQSLARSRRVVVKIGSALLDRDDNRSFSRFARQLAQLRDEKRHLVLVSSGAISQGLPLLGYKRRPSQLGKLQAAAAVGQPELMRRWGLALSRYGITTAQVLLTHNGLANRERFLNARHALFNLEKRGVLPVANENDTVATDEIRVGDNDSLAAHVASLVGADLLILLTTVDGLHDQNPERARDAARIPVVDKARDAMRFAGAAGRSGLGTGGMVTKIEAADTAAAMGIPVVIADGRRPQVLHDIIAGDDIGTLFVPGEQLQGRKHWIAYTLRPKGMLHVDDGAAAAMYSGGSLLPSGVTAVEGQFARGEMVDIVSSAGLVARGLAAYSAGEVRLLVGRDSKEIRGLLGYVDTKAVVHSHDLVVLLQE